VGALRLILLVPALFLTAPATAGATGRSNRAPLVTVDPPAIAASFSPTAIAPNGVATLTITITDPSANAVPEDGVAFTDSLPANVVVATPNGLTNTCGGTATATAGSGAVSLAGGTVAVSSSCTVTVNVTGSFTGSYADTAGPVSSTNGGTGGSASASLTIANPPSISTLFLPNQVSQNQETELSFEIDNPNSNSFPPNSDVTLTGVGFTDSLPAGLVVASPSQASNSCGGTLTAVPGASAVTLHGGTVPVASETNPSGACFISLEVTPTSAGTRNNTTGPVSAFDGSDVGAPSNTASLTVTAAPSVTGPTLSQSAGSPAILPGRTDTLNFTLANPNAATELVSAGFSDTLPAGLALTDPTGFSGTCLTTGGGVATGSAGSQDWQVSLVDLPASTSCTVVVDVVGTAPGNLVNTTGKPTASYDNGSGDFSAISGSPASAAINVVGPPTLTQAPSQGSVRVGGTDRLTFRLTNPNASARLSNVRFPDTLAPRLRIAALPDVGGSCLAKGSVSGATPNSRYFTERGASLAPKQSCTVTVSVTPFRPGSFVSTSGAPKGRYQAGVSAVVLQGAPASATISAVAPQRS
jgi:hypothetical protein